MAELFASGRIADVAIAILLFEALLFVWLHARRRLGPAPGELLPNVAAGALRGALVGAGWPWIAASLAAALAAHLADLARRWSRGR